MNGPLPETARRQFTLQQLFILITAIAIWLSLIAWFGLFGFCLGSVMAITIVSYFRWARGTEVIILLALVTILFFVSLPDSLFVVSSGGTSRKSMCRNNLQRIAIALSLYADEHGSYPPIAAYSTAGRPLHSWRAHILPHLEESSLARQYDWTEPWNGPVNSQIDTNELRVFQCPTDKAKNKEGTSYLAIEVPGAKPGDPFVVIEVHGTGIGVFEPRDIALDDILTAATHLPPRTIRPRGGHGHNAQIVQVAWPTGVVEAMPLDELPQRLPGLLFEDLSQRSPQP